MEGMIRLVNIFQILRMTCQFSQSLEYCVYRPHVSLSPYHTKPRNQQEMEQQNQQSLEMPFIPFENIQLICEYV